jgi:hypothetical protein
MSTKEQAELMAVAEATVMVGLNTRLGGVGGWVVGREGSMGESSTSLLLKYRQFIHLASSQFPHQKKMTSAAKAL